MQCILRENKASLYLNRYGKKPPVPVDLGDVKMSKNMDIQVVAE